MPFTKGHKLGAGRPKGAKNINKGFINQIALDLIGSFKSGTNYVSQIVNQTAQIRWHAVQWNWYEITPETA